MQSAFVDVAYRTFANDTGDTANLRTKREVASPRSRLDTRSLFDDDDVPGVRHFNRGRAEMFSRCRTTVVDAKFDSNDTACNFPLSRQLVNAGNNSTHAEFIHRIRDGTCIEPIQARS
jgi:hypothetical protein